MKLVIVSGLSGSGKSTVLHVLEDLRYYAIDNLPITLLPQFANSMCDNTDVCYSHAAISIDARNRHNELKHFPRIVQELRDTGVDVEVIYLDADDHILLRRFSETRRKHPLTSDATGLPEAIAQERQLLQIVSEEASLYLDTTQTSLHDLRALIKQRVANRSSHDMSIMFQSFGFKHGVPVDADLVFDVRCLPNPYWDPELRSFNGLQQPIKDFLEKHDDVQQMYDDIRTFLERWIPTFEAGSRTYLTIAIGCTGGHHRSVYMTERLRAHFAPRGLVLSRNRDL
ncbi:MAG: RNase adapter RapZ [Gammaproteobacteria bacterium]|nr:RNase adapter RapZ [Gammaproteobacteria bacterium]